MAARLPVYQRSTHLSDLLGPGRADAAGARLLGRSQLEARVLRAVLAVLLMAVAAVQARPPRHLRRRRRRRRLPVRGDDFFLSIIFRVLLFSPIVLRGGFKEISCRWVTDLDTELWEMFSGIE